VDDEFINWGDFSFSFLPLASPFSFTKKVSKQHDDDDDDEDDSAGVDSAAAKRKERMEQ
jgi:hypothetical protein